MTRAATLIEITNSGMAGGSSATRGKGALCHVAMAPSLEVSSVAAATLLPEPPPFSHFSASVLWGWSAMVDGGEAELAAI